MGNTNEWDMREDVKYLQDWLNQAENLAIDIRTQAQKEGGLAIFTISTTVKVRENGHPFLTPVRRIIHGFIGGAVVFSQTQAILLCKRVDGMIDQILVDAEKKISITLGIDESVLKHFGLEPPRRKDYARVHVEMGNLSVACELHIKKSHFQEYKPNDVTVESVWHFLSNKYRTLSGKRVAIIGSGNIGFKLALKLVESGSHVELVRRDLWRGILMADVINIAKPESTIAIAHYNPNPLQASLFCDVLIGCTDGTPAITWKMIQSMKPDGIVIDVGKGCVFKDAVQKAVKHEIPIIRCDITSAIDGLISTIERTQTIMKHEMGRQEIEKGVFIVSGGYMGLSGDIVVDNYRNPIRIIGVANGMGDLKRYLSEKDQHNIAVVKKINSILEEV
ncbi:MAG: hypothetical protein HQ555_12945 [Candidatus Aminicenantes bacterium]|nr:hypothetical protein [Candidatus Aminicenantes bacterium]